MRILEKASNVMELESTFDTKLEMPKEDENLEQTCGCPSGTHLNSLQCLCCN